MIFLKKRESAALFVLSVMILLSIWNLRKIDSITDGIIVLLEKSQTSAENLDNKSALRSLNDGLKIWLDSDRYTHIFIRHSEIDSTTDAFYELKESLMEGNALSARAAYEKLRYHLESIDTMEHPSLGSIF